MNNKPIRIFRNEQFSKYKWKDIKCGDIIQVLCDEHLPCDVLLLNTKSDDKKCFVTTANLDGETNFKVRNIKKNIHGIVISFFLIFRQKVLQMQYLDVIVKNK